MDTPSSTQVSIARGVAARLAEGWSHEDAIREAATILGISTGAVAHCCAVVADFFRDEYLEGFEQWQA